MKFIFSSLHFDGGIKSKWDVLLRIVGDFSIIVVGRRLYAETDFCLVEFAIALANWLADASDDGPDFSYTSMESETEGLVRLTLIDHNKWRVSAADQEIDETTLLSTEQVKNAASKYIHELRNALLPGIDIYQYIESEKALKAVRAC